MMKLYATLMSQIYPQVYCLLCVVSQYQEYKAGRGSARSQNNSGTRVSRGFCVLIEDNHSLNRNCLFFLEQLARKYSIHTATADDTFTSRRETTTKKSTDEQLNLLYEMHSEQKFK